MDSSQPKSNPFAQTTVLPEDAESRLVMDDKEPLAPSNETKAAGATQPLPPLVRQAQAQDSLAMGATEHGAGGAAPAAARPGPVKEIVLGDFRLLKELGSGGMGKVFKAHQISLDRPVALKVMKKDLAANAEFVERFRREARLQAKLDHPNVVRGYAVTQEGGRWLFAMEFIDGGNLQSWLKKLGRLGVGDAVHVALAVAHALQHAHEQNMIHRDVKPENVMITSKGVVKVADLGLAKALDDDMSLTQSGMGAGTPFYMAPEQARDAKRVDHRADVYAVGVMLYVLLTGELPFKGGTTLELIMAKETGKFPPARRINPDVPDKLDLMIDKMLAKNPEHRYQSCAELIKDLESLGVANETLSFIEGATGRIGGSVVPAVKTVPAPSKPAATKVEAPPVDKPKPDWWYLELEDHRGRIVPQKFAAHQIHDMIKNDEITAKTQASRTNVGGFRPLATYREFEGALRARVRKEKADRRNEKVRDFMANIEKEEKKYKRQKFFQRIVQTLGRWVTFGLVLALIGGICVALYFFGVPLLVMLKAKLGLGE